MRNCESSGIVLRMSFVILVHGQRSYFPSRATSLRSSSSLVQSLTRLTSLPTVMAYEPLALRQIEAEAELQTIGVPAGAVDIFAGAVEILGTNKHSFNGLGDEIDGEVGIFP